LAARIAAPLAIVHGTGDRFIAPTEAPRLFARASEPRRLDLVRGMGHAFDAVGLPSICAAVDWALGCTRPVLPA
jgi:hypothetical protein